MPKYTCHVPTEQYGFIAVEVDGTADEAVEAYNDLKIAFTEGAGLAPKEWNSWLDEYLKGKAGNIEEWEQMSFKQKSIINEIKKSNKRTTK